jgi:predicted GNAT superfamily acetyltransferase
MTGGQAGPAADHAAARPAQPEVRLVHDPAELGQVTALYRRVFGLNHADGAINTRLLVALDMNSGHVIGAFLDGELVGFGYSFLALDDRAGRLLQYSQTTAVAPEMQGRGIGRAVKLAQRRAALDRGIDLMRWAFDPMRAHNAHFNLDVLGGTVSRFVPQMYGDAAPGRDVGDMTDRFIVDWELAGPRRPEHGQFPARTSLRAGATSRIDDATLVAIPAAWPEVRRQHGTAHARRLRAETADHFAQALADGLTAVSCQRIDAETAAYLFVAGSPRPSAAGTAVT